MTATAAPAYDRRCETRQVGPFERVDLRDPVNRVELVLEPGEHQTVVVEGRPDMLHRVNTRVEAGVLWVTIAGTLAEHVRDALTTSHGRHLLVYRIRAPRLDEVRVAGRVSVSLLAFGADAPVVTRMEPQAPTPPAAPAPPR